MPPSVLRLPHGVICVELFWSLNLNNVLFAMGINGLIRQLQQVIVAPLHIVFIQALDLHIGAGHLLASLVGFAQNVPSARLLFHFFQSFRVYWVDVLV
jgi:hypothetical protein